MKQPKISRASILCEPRCSSLPLRVLGILEVLDTMQGDFVLTPRNVGTYDASFYVGESAVTNSLNYKLQEQYGLVILSFLGS